MGCPLRNVSRFLTLSPLVRQRAQVFLAYLTANDLAALGGMIEAGGVRPVVGPSCSMARAADAFRHIGGGHACGRAVVTSGSSADGQDAVTCEAPRHRP